MGGALRMRVEDGNAAEAKEWDYKGVTCNSAGARDGVDCCRSKRKATELRLGFRLAGRSLPGSSGSLAKTERGIIPYNWALFHWAEPRGLNTWGDTALKYKKGRE